MTLAQLLSFSTVAPSPEAQARIDSARAGDVAFMIRQVSQRKLSDDDVKMLADAMIRAERQEHSVTPQAVERILREMGRTTHKARELTSAIFKS